MRCKRDIISLWIFAFHFASKYLIRLLLFNLRDAYNKSMRSIKSLTFFGSSEGKPGDAHFDAAFNTANEVARIGIEVVNGGGPGVMYAATLGATQGGGKVTTVYYVPKYATTFEGIATYNIATHEFKKQNYIERTKKLLELGDAYIIFKGGTGTISEFGMAWGLARLYFGHHKPLLLYGDFWQDIIDQFKRTMRIRSEDLKVFQIVRSPEEVIKAIHEYDVILEKNRHEHKKCDINECGLIL